MRWLKKKMPRGLYSRAALILFIPVLVVQLVFGIVFLSNHFERITRQMTMSVLDDLSFLLDQIPEQGFEETRDGIARDLGFTLERAEPPQVNRRLFYDVSIFYILPTFGEEFTVLAYDTIGDAVSDDNTATFWIEWADEPLMVSFSRSRVSASNPHQLVLWTLLAGILTYIIALIFLRNQLRPIKRLSQAAEAFGRGQVVPMNPAGATEVRAAGIAFLSMRSRLARHTEQRTQMLSAVSHDLRTPLTRLKLGLEMIGEDTTDLQRDVQDMDQMIEGFLNFARDGTEETTRSVDLTDLVRSVIEDHKRAGDPISVGMLDETGPVSLRPNLMRRAIKNLISNAVRYGERALVSLTVLDTSVRIRVEDSGPGIPETMRSEAILPFNRLDAARNQDKGGGVGLGLAIVADVARLHGGVVRLSDSQELGGLSADIVLSRD